MGRRPFRRSLRAAGVRAFPVRLAAYAAAVAALGVGALAMAWPGRGGPLGRAAGNPAADAGLVAALMLLYAVSYLVFAVPFGSGVRVTVGFPLLMTVLLAAGTWPAMVAAVLGSALLVWTAGYAPGRGLFQAGAHVLAVLAAGSAFASLGGRFGSVHAPWDLLRAPAAFAAYDLVLRVLVLGWIALEEGRPVVALFRQLAAAEPWGTVLVRYLAAVCAAWLYQGLGAWGLVLGTGLVAWMYWDFRLQAEVLEVRRASLTDQLTGAGNYRLFDRLRASVDGRWAVGPAGLLVVDLNCLKTINDTYGHSAGDRVLQVLAATIRSAVRQSDYVIRYAGDEFVVVLPGADREEAVRVARRIANAVDAQRVDVGGRETYFSVSVGVATVGPGEPIDLDELFLRADRAMYRGKGLQYTTVNEEAEAPV